MSLPFLQVFVWGCFFFDYWMAPAALALTFIVQYCIVSAQSKKPKSQKHLAFTVGSSEVSSMYCT